MNKELIKQMETEIENLLIKLEGLEAGSVEYNGVISAISKLYDTVNKEKEIGLSEDRLDIDRLKIESDKELKIKQLEVESDRDEMNLLNNREQRESDEIESFEDRQSKDKDLKHSTRETVLKTVVEGAAIIVPVVFYGIWMQRGFKFEEEGSITSSTFKGLIGKFKPTR